MGRGRSFAGHKIVPPKGARWAPKPNVRARCMKFWMGKAAKGGKGLKFMDATSHCEGLKGQTKYPTS